MILSNSNPLYDLLQIDYPELDSIDEFFDSLYQRRFNIICIGIINIPEREFIATNEKIIRFLDDQGFEVHKYYKYFYEGHPQLSEKNGIEMVLGRMSTEYQEMLSSIVGCLMASMKNLLTEKGCEDSELALEKCGIEFRENFHHEPVCQCQPDLELSVNYKTTFIASIGAVSSYERNFSQLYRDFYNSPDAEHGILLQLCPNLKSKIIKVNCEHWKRYDALKKFPMVNESIVNKDEAGIDHLKGQKISLIQYQSILYKPEDCDKDHENPDDPEMNFEIPLTELLGGIPETLQASCTEKITDDDCVFFDLGYIQKYLDRLAVNDMFSVESFYEYNPTREARWY